MAVQNIKIKYSADTNDLAKAEKAIGKLTAAEKATVAELEKLNTSAKKTTETLKKGFDNVADATDDAGNKVSALSDVISSGFSIDSLRNLGSELKNVGKLTDENTGKISKMKVGIAGAATAALAMGAAIGTAVKTTEQGGDNATKNINRLKFAFAGAIEAVGSFGNKALQVFTDAVAGTDDFSKGVDEATDRLDNLEEATIDVALANAKLQLEADKSLKSLRNRTLTYQEQIKIIEELGATEKQILDANLGLVNEEMEATKLDLLNKLGSDKERRKSAQETFDKLISGELNLTDSLTILGDRYTSDELQRITTILQKRQDAYRQYEILEVRMDNFKDNFRQAEIQRLLKELQFNEQIKQRQLTLEEASDRLKIANLLKSNDDRIKLTQKFIAEEKDLYGRASNDLLQTEKDLLLKRAELEKAYSKTSIEISRITTTAKKKDLKEVEVANQDLQEALNDAYDKELEAKQKRDDQRRMIEDATAQAIQMITSEVFSREQQQRDEAFNNLKKRKENELALAGENEEKRKVIEQKIREEEKRLRRQDAVAKKNEAIFEIALQTALNVAKALGLPPIPGGNVVAAGTAAALGAVQLGIVASRPIPAYKDGTKNHKGGLAIVGDGYKQEMVITPDGYAFVTPNKPTVMDLAKGSMILPDAKKVNDIDYGRFKQNATSTALNETNVKLDKINTTLSRLQKVQVNIDQKGISTYLLNSTNSTKVLNNRYSA